MYMYMYTHSELLGSAGPSVGALPVWYTVYGIAHVYDMIEHVLQYTRARSMAISIGSSTAPSRGVFQSHRMPQSFHMVRIGRRRRLPERVRGACIISSFLTSRSPPTNGKAKSVSRLAMRARTRSMLAFFFCQHRRTVPQSNTAVMRRSTSTLIFSLLCSFLRGVLCAPATCSHVVWHPARTSNLASMAALP